MERYTHTRLANSDTEFRLLEFSDGDNDTPVACSLQTFSFDQVPIYYAISYCWGSPVDPVGIVVDGKTMSVNHNCWYALRQVRRHNRHAMYWIDSICIDQDDLDEKAAQVGRMASIFQNAAYVCASLGPDAEDSRYLIKCLHDFPSTETAQSLSSVATVSGFVEEDVHRRTTRWLVSLTDFRRFAEALKVFSGRPFFSRLWVYQEMFYASDAIMFCGDVTARMTALKDIVEVMRTILMSYRPLQDYDYKDAQSKLLPLMTDNGLFDGRKSEDGLNTLPHLVGQLHRYGKKSAMRNFGDAAVGIAEVQLAIRRLHCQDPRDKIFGLVSVFDFGGSDSTYHIMPDYKISSLQLGLQVLRSYSSFPDARRCILLADMLSINLQLHPSMPEVKDALTMIQSRRTAALSKFEERKQYTRGEVLKENTGYACRITRTGSDSLTAPFKSPWSALNDESTESSDVGSTRGTLLQENGKSLNVNGRRVAAISEDVEPGDWIAELSHYNTQYSSSLQYRIGLVLRERADKLFEVVGEAVFYPQCTPCYSHETCACQSGPSVHPEFAAYFTLEFDRTELLLFAVRLRAEYGDTEDNLISGTPHLPASAFPMIERTSAVLKWRTEPIVKRLP